MCQLEIGDAFIFQTPPNYRHLYIIIAEISSESLLLVNITTSKTQIDIEKDCIINPGEGASDFVTCQSTVAYQYAREERNNNIKQLIKEGRIIYDGSFSEEYIYEIQRKGAYSENLKYRYKKVLKEILIRQGLSNYG